MTCNFANLHRSQLIVLFWAEAYCLCLCHMCETRQEAQTPILCNTQWTKIWQPSQMHPMLDTSAKCKFLCDSILCTQDPLSDAGYSDTIFFACHWLLSTIAVNPMRPTEEFYMPAFEIVAAYLHTLAHLRLQLMVIWHDKITTRRLHKYSTHIFTDSADNCGW